MTRRYGRAPKGERVIGAVPQNYGANVTMLAALGCQGVEAVMTIDGATDAEEQRYEETAEHMIAMGALLKDELRAARWRVLNDTPLPIACFTDEGGADPQAIVNRVLASGQAWCSTTLLGGSDTVLRACITNYTTEAPDVRALVAVLIQE